MSKKKTVFTLAAAVLLITAVVVIVKSHSQKDVTPQEMMKRIEDALGDEYEKQSMTEVAATIVYGDGNKENNIYYHVLKTTFYASDPVDVTGLNTNAIGALFDLESAESCREMKIQSWDGALYETSGHCYLCWTYSPKVSYVLEYNPDAVSEAEIIRMAESVKPIENASQADDKP